MTVPVTGEGMGVYNLASVYDVGMREQRDAAHVRYKKHREQQLDSDMSSYEFPHGVVRPAKIGKKFFRQKKAVSPIVGILPSLYCVMPQPVMLR